MRTIYGLVMGCLLICSLSLAGCGKGNDPSLSLEEYNKTNILRLRNAYEMYMFANNYKGPKDKEELVAYMTGDAAAKIRLERLGITLDMVDTIFTSERDEKPFFVRWGLEGQADHAIVFEETGVEGKRLVALATPREMDDDEYEGYRSGKIKPEMPAGAQDMGPTAEDMAGPESGEG